MTMAVTLIMDTVPCQSSCIVPLGIRDRFTNDSQKQKPTQKLKPLEADGKLGKNAACLENVNNLSPTKEIYPYY